MQLIIISLIVSLITQILKRFGLKEKYGDLGVHLAIFVMGVAIALIQTGLKFIPADYAKIVIDIWTGAVGWYEIILKRFKKTTELAENKGQK